ncbi:MAG: ribulokinase [Caldisericales bacterium]|nr:ribulokinase [bacterium]
MGRILLGADFGTSQVNVVALDVKTGQTIGFSSSPYKSGVIEKTLPDGTKLPRGFALQDPSDWLEGLFEATKKLIEETRIPEKEIISIGVSFTSCTVLPVDVFGTPLCMIGDLSKNPHAWPKLWRHTTAQPQANLLTSIAQERGEPFLDFYGGKMGAEWLWPKLLELVQEAPELVPSIEYFIEAGDWIVWQLTGHQVRNQCAAGYKACWVEGAGYPGHDYFASISQELADLSDKARGIEVLPPGRPAGKLIKDMAGKMGLRTGIPVASAVIDAQSAVAGAGVFEPNIMTIVMGSSNCHLVMSKQEKLFVGYAGVVKDGILDGYWGYEAGQPAMSDMLEWFVNTIAPISFYERANEDETEFATILDRYLSEVPAGSNGVLALDWMGGNRSVLLDSSLSGVFAGLTLQTRAEDMYKALAEASAFGTRKIIETFRAGGVEIKQIVATGALPITSPSLIQIYADVLGMPISVPDTNNATGRGAAIIGGLSVGMEKLGHKSRESYFKALLPQTLDWCKPLEANKQLYNDIYNDYLTLHDMFGGTQRVLARLRERGKA